MRGYRPRQLAARAAARTRVLLPLPLPDPGPAPPFRPDALARIAALVGGAPDDERILAAVERGDLQIAGRVRPLDPQRLWAPPATPEEALFSFHVHYHAWLVPVARDPRLRAVAAEVVRNWLTPTPNRADLRLAWHPYVVSSRVLPWAAIANVIDDERLKDAMRRSLWRQLHVLECYPERDVAGNHLLRNGAALAVGGALFPGPRADEMRRRGCALLTECLEDQVLSDGMHVEGSPSYQALVLADALSAINASPGDAPPRLGDLAGRVAGWLSYVSPPGRPRPHLNDSVEGQAPPTSELLEACALAGVTPSRPGAGAGPRIAVLGDADTRLVFDAAPVCRPDLPYHAHADSLTVLVDIEGVPVVVDRGAADYAGPRRPWWRATAAHSTVQVAGLDSSEMIGSHRAGRIARTYVEIDAERRLVARHDGGGIPALAHRRAISHTGPASWLVEDTTPGSPRFTWRLHLAPGAFVSTRGSRATIVVGSRRLSVATSGTTSLRVDEADHAASVGRTIRAPVLVAEASGGRVVATIAAD